MSGKTRDRSKRQKRRDTEGTSPADTIGNEYMDIDVGEFSTASTSASGSGSAPSSSTVTEMLDKLPPDALTYNGRRDFICIPPPTHTGVCSFQTNKPRLVVEYISLNNFKTFYGTQKIGPFYKGMTAIFGTGKSGKSTVLDAMLFVFGILVDNNDIESFNSLIHYTDEHKNIPSCSVTISCLQIIDKGPDVPPVIIPDSKITFSRTVVKNVESYYQLNEKHVEFTDLDAELRRHGIDLTCYGRFIILKGKVEKLAHLNAKTGNVNNPGVLEYLDYVIGTTRYNEHYNKAMEIASRTEQELEALNKFIRAAKGQLFELKKDRDQLIKYLKHENAIIEGKNKLYQYHCYRIKLTLASLEKSLKTQNKIFNDLKGKLDKEARITSEKESTYNELEIEVRKLTALCNEMQQKFDSSQSQNNSLEADKDACILRRREYRNMLTSELRALNDYEELIEKNEKELKDLETLICQWELEEALSTEELTAAKEKVAKESVEGQEQLRPLSDLLAKLVKKFVDKKSAYELKQLQLAATTGTEKEQNYTLEDFKKSLMESKETYRKNKDEMREVDQKLKAVRDKIKKVDEEIQKENAEKTAIYNKIDDLIVEIRKAIAANERCIYRGILTPLLKESAAGRIPNVYGRLGDFGTIDVIYDKAISSNVDALDSIVVDTTDTAVACIIYLKEHNLGKANFIALNNLPEWTQDFNKYKNAFKEGPRLLDLITIENEIFLPAFYFACEDTLVADNIDEAQRISLVGENHHRVFELGGGAVEPDGSVTSGGEGMTGRINTTVAGEAIQTQTAAVVNMDVPKLQQDVEQLRDKLSGHENKIEELTGKLTDLSTQVIDLENEQRKIARSLTHLIREIPHVEAYIKAEEEIAKNKKPDPIEVKNIKKNIKIKKEELEVAEAAVNEVKLKMCNIYKQLQDIKMKYTEKLESTRKELGNKIRTAISDKEKLRAKILSTKRDITTTQDKIVDIEKTIKKLDREIKKMPDKSKKQEANSTEALDKICAVQKKIKEKNEELQKLKNDITEKSAGLQHLKTENNDKRQVVIKMEKLIQNCKTDISTYEDKLKDLNLHILPAAKGEEKLKTYDNNELRHEKEINLQHEIDSLENVLRIQPNFSAVKEFKKKNIEYLELGEEFQKVTEEKERITSFIGKMNCNRRKEFMVGFKAINSKFQEAFRMLSSGGDAELELVDSDPYTDGIILTVRPRSKPWTAISKLNSTEKSLLSLAFIISLHYYKPSPFFMIDDIDSGLNEHDASVVGSFIKSYLVNAQFAIICKRTKLIEQFNYRVFGICKPGPSSCFMIVDPNVLEMLVGTAVDERPIEPAPTSTTTDNEATEDSDASLSSDHNEPIGDLTESK